MLQANTAQQTAENLSKKAGVQDKTFSFSAYTAMSPLALCQNALQEVASTFITIMNLIQKQQQNLIKSNQEQAKLQATQIEEGLKNEASGMMWGAVAMAITGGLSLALAVGQGFAQNKLGSQGAHLENELEATQKMKTLKAPDGAGAPAGDLTCTLEGEQYNIRDLLKNGEIGKVRQGYEAGQLNDDNLGRTLDFMKQSHPEEYEAAKLAMNTHFNGLQSEKIATTNLKAGVAMQMSAFTNLFSTAGSTANGGINSHYKVKTADNNKASTLASNANQVSNGTMQALGQAANAAGREVTGVFQALAQLGTQR